MWLGGRMRRRVSGGLGPAPVLATLRRTALAASYGALLGGGDAFTVTGTGFVSGAILELTNLSTTEVTNVATTGSGSSLACTLPALVEGDYSSRIKNPDGQYSTTNLPLAVVRLPESIVNVKGAYSQRGDANDYVPTGTTTAPLWKDRTANARHIVGRNVAANQAPVASPIDGKSAIRRAAADGMGFPDQSWFPSAFFTQTAMSVLTILRVGAGANASNQTTDTSSTFPSPPFINSASAGGAYSAAAYGIGSAPTKGTFSIGIYNAGWKMVSIRDFLLTELNAFLARHDGATMKVAKNAAPSTGVSLAAGSKDSAESATYTYQFLSGDVNHDSYTYAHYVGTMTEAELVSILRFERFYNLPTAGF